MGLIDRDGRSEHIGRIRDASSIAITALELEGVGLFIWGEEGELAAK
jgi:hypothetical protein